MCGIVPLGWTVPRLGLSAFSTWRGGEHGLSTVRNRELREPTQNQHVGPTETDGNRCNPEPTWDFHVTFIWLSYDFHVLNLCFFRGDEVEIGRVTACTVRNAICLSSQCNPCLKCNLLCLSFPSALGPHRSTKQCLGFDLLWDTPWSFDQNLLWFANALPPMLSLSSIFFSILFSLFFSIFFSIYSSLYSSILSYSSILFYILLFFSILLYILYPPPCFLPGERGRGMAATQRSDGYWMSFMWSGSSRQRDCKAKPGWAWLSHIWCYHILSVGTIDRLNPRVIETYWNHFKNRGTAQDFSTWDELVGCLKWLGKFWTEKWWPTSSRYITNQ